MKRHMVTSEIEDEQKKRMKLDHFFSNVQMAVNNVMSMLIGNEDDAFRYKYKTEISIVQTILARCYNEEHECFDATMLLLLSLVDHKDDFPLRPMVCLNILFLHVKYDIECIRRSNMFRGIMTENKLCKVGFGTNHDEIYNSGYINYSNPLIIAIKHVGFINRLTDLVSNYEYLNLSPFGVQVGFTFLMEPLLLHRPEDTTVIENMSADGPYMKIHVYNVHTFIEFFKASRKLNRISFVDHEIHQDVTAEDQFELFNAIFQCHKLETMEISGKGINFQIMFRALTANTHQSSLKTIRIYQKHGLGDDGALALGEYIEKFSKCGYDDRCIDTLDIESMGITNKQLAIIGDALSLVRHRKIMPNIMMGNNKFDNDHLKYFLDKSNGHIKHLQYLNMKMQQEPNQMKSYANDIQTISDSRYQSIEQITCIANRSSSDIIYNTLCRNMISNWNIIRIIGKPCGDAENGVLSSLLRRNQEHKKNKRAFYGLQGMRADGIGQKSIWKCDATFIFQ